MGGGFVPWRRDVRWLAEGLAPIRPLLGRLALTRGRQAWGAQFRFGLVQVSPADLEVVEEAMRAAPRG